MGMKLNTLPDVKLYVYPPQSFLSKSHGLYLDKSSPDDWIEEGYTYETIFNLCVEVNIPEINKFQKTYFTQNSKSVSKPNKFKEVNDWFYSCLEGRLIYCSETSEYYFYNINRGFWGSYDNKGLIDNILYESDRAPFFGYRLRKIIGPKFLKSPEEIQELFSNTRYVGFENGVWDLKAKKLLDHSPEYYLIGVLPFNFIFKNFENNVVQEVCPNICSWLLERVGEEEIYANILICFLLAVILNISNPERFLFLTGYSASGKSTALKLLGSVVPPRRTYITGVEGLTGTVFGLQELTGLQKNLIVCHDLGSSVPPSFVNLLRNPLLGRLKTFNGRTKTPPLWGLRVLSPI